MPIKGMSDRPVSFPEIGSIRKGAPKGDFKPGADLQWFRTEFDDREVSARTKFLQVYGPKPVEINILLPFDDIERCWDPYLEAYLAGALIYRSDGERVLYWIDHTTGARKVINGQPHTPHIGDVITEITTSKGKRLPVKAKPTGRLKVIIPELERLAYLTVHTTSVHDVINISAQLDAIKTLNGRLAGIPLKLRRRPQMISMPGEDGKRVRREKWLISIEADPEWVAAKLGEMKRLALPEAAPTASAMLSAPVVEHAAGPAPARGPVWSEFQDDEDEGGDVVEGAAVATETPAQSGPAEPDAQAALPHGINDVNAIIAALKAGATLKDLAAAVNGKNGRTLFEAACKHHKIDKQIRADAEREAGKGGAVDWAVAILALAPGVTPF